MIKLCFNYKMNLIFGIHVECRKVKNKNKKQKTRYLIVKF